MRFLYDGSYTDFRRKLKELGETPLPKYIKRKVEAEDEKDIKLFMQSMKVQLQRLLLVCISPSIC